MRATGGLHDPKPTKMPAATPSHRKLLRAREFPHSLGPKLPRDPRRLEPRHGRRPRKFQTFLTGIFQRFRSSTAGQGHHWPTRGTGYALAGGEHQRVLRPIGAKSDHSQDGPSAARVGATGRWTPSRCTARQPLTTIKRIPLQQSGTACRWARNLSVLSREDDEPMRIWRPRRGMRCSMRRVPPKGDCAVLRRPASGALVLRPRLFRQTASAPRPVS